MAQTAPAGNITPIEPGHWKRKLPTLLTLSRAFLAPIVVICLYVPGTLGHVLAGLCFILASLTDWWDGHFARRYGVVSDFGRFMDPIADKVLVTTVLIMLCYLRWIDPFVVMLLVVRDLLIGGIRAVAATRNTVIAAKPAGKWKTAIQMISIPAILYHGSFGPIPLSRLGYLLLWVSVIFSLISGFEYLQIYLRSE